jgi:DNA-binding transcriptional LysR family regulator
VLADLREVRTDLAVLNLIEAEGELHSQPLYRDRITAFVPAAHPWAGRAAITLDELAKEPLVLREPGSATRALLLAALERAGVSLRTALELGSREAVREAVLAGLGVGTVFERELIPDTRLRPIAIEGAGLDATVSLACLPERRGLRAVQAFFALAAPDRAAPG